MATLAQLQARCDGGQFTLNVVTPTVLILGTHPLQPRVTTSATSPRVAITWSALWRGKGIKSFATLVADANLSAYAQQLVLDYAMGELDVYDLRLGTYGKVPGPAFLG